MKIYLYYEGKKRDLRANAICDDFIARTSHFYPTQLLEIKPAKFDLWSKHPNAFRIVLDPAGQSLDSPAFAVWMQKAELRAVDLVFFVAGSDGPPPLWRERADMLLSLSLMTYPHELARAMLAEQIYRAFTVLRGHPYPRQ